MYSTSDGILFLPNCAIPSPGDHPRFCKEALVFRFHGLCVFRHKELIMCKSIDTPTGLDGLENNVEIIARGIFLELRKVW